MGSGVITPCILTPVEDGGGLSSSRFGFLTSGKGIPETIG
jgi:hypothetical protein